MDVELGRSMRQPIHAKLTPVFSKGKSTAKSHGGVQLSCRRPQYFFIDNDG